MPDVCVSAAAAIWPQGCPYFTHTTCTRKPDETRVTMEGQRGEMKRGGCFVCRKCIRSGARISHSTKNRVCPLPLREDVSSWAIRGPLCLLMLCIESLTIAAPLCNNTQSTTTTTQCTRTSIFRTGPGDRREGEMTKSFRNFILPASFHPSTD